MSLAPIGLTVPLVLTALSVGATQSHAAHCGLESGRLHQIRSHEARAALALLQLQSRDAPV
jgi:hypothetical protein